MPYLMTFVPLILVIIFMYLIGRFCRNIAENKGYDGNMFFWMGVFFSIPTLIIVSLLPDHNL